MQGGSVFRRVGFVVLTAQGCHCEGSLRVHCLGCGSLHLQEDRPRVQRPQALAVPSVFEGPSSFLFLISFSFFSCHSLKSGTTTQEVPILSSLTEEEVIKAADALEPVSFEAGAVIIKQGDFGDTFYIVEEGTLSVRVEGENEVVAKKEKGDYFGGIALCCFFPLPERPFHLVLLSILLLQKSPF